MVSQDRQVNFSRTVCTTFHWRGMTSSVSVIVSPSLAGAATAWACCWARNHHPFARQMRRQRTAHGLAADERLDVRAACVGIGTEAASSAGTRLQFLEFQLHLIEQLAATFR